MNSRNPSDYIRWLSAPVHVAAFLGAGLLVPAFVCAQETESDTKELKSIRAKSIERSVPAINEGALERTFFDRFNPQTALDIVQRVPGFTFNAGDDLRGFGGNAGNVLIDGVRPSAKSGGLEDVLRRLPANDIFRVEIIRGGAGNSEAAGQAVVVNLLRAGAGRSGNWKAEVERNSEGVIYPRGETSVNWRSGDWTNALKINGFWEQYDLVGRRDRFDPDGGLSIAQTEDRPSVLTEGFLSGEAMTPFAGGLLTLNGRFGYSGFFPDTDRLQYSGREPDETPDGSTSIDFDSGRWTGELGVDWTRTLGSTWSFKLISLVLAEPLKQRTLIETTQPLGTPAPGTRFEREQAPLEVVLRSMMSQFGSRTLRTEFGLELAYNRLDSEFDFFTVDAAGVESPVTLPAADVTVSESRGDAFVNLIWTSRPHWTIETGVATEVSRISVKGDAENQQRFLFLKPSANLIFTPQNDFQLRVGARRTVGQLDFGDFAASAEGDTEREFGGNPDLGPDQTWRTEVAVDWRRQSLGAINVIVFHEWRKDVLEQITLPAGGFGLGNAGDGRVWGVTASSALNLARFLRGGLLEARMTLQDSTFDDPVIGRSRALNEIISPVINVDFRQDLVEHSMSWGISYRAADRNLFYFGDELSDFRQGREWRAFIESTRWRDVKTRLALRGIGERNFFNERLFFSPDRRGIPAGSEVSDRDRGLFINLSFERQF